MPSTVMFKISVEKMSDKRLRIGLNGFGRIGRCVTRILADRDDIDLGKSD